MTFDLFLSHYQWGSDKGTIYHLTKQQQTIYLTWKQLMKRFEEPEVAFHKKELSSLFKEILPLLDQIGTVAIDDEVTAEVADIPVEFVFVLKNERANSSKDRFCIWRCCVLHR